RFVFHSGPLECPLGLVFFGNGVDLAVFFFHAEDGIRDFHVTGVQTCALPISPRRVATSPWRSRWASACSRSSARASRSGPSSSRSEERRVGKESRVSGSPALSEQIAMRS